MTATGDDFTAPCLVLLMGPPASGKTSYAQAHFAWHEIVGPDECAWLLTDGSIDCDAETRELLDLLITTRLRFGRRVCVDATNLHAAERGWLRDLAFQHGAFCHLVIMETPLAENLRRDAARELPRDPAIIERCYARHQTAKQEALEEGYDSVRYVMARDAEEETA